MNKKPASGKWLVVSGLRILLLATFYLLLTTYCLFATSISGYYETEFSAREDSDFKWNLTTPKHYFQMKLWSNPLYGLDLYGQLSARTNEPWNRKDYFDFERGWFKYWFGKGEVLGLINEERHWIDSPLLKNVDQYKAAYFNDGLGMRLNIFKLGPLSGSFVFTQKKPLSRQEWYGNYFDESSHNLISKINMTILPTVEWLERIVIGGSHLSLRSEQKKFDYAGNYLSSHLLKNDVSGADVKVITPYGATLTGEYAVSFKDGSANSPSRAEDNSSAAVELRDLYIKPFKFQAKAYNYGEGFRNELSRNFGRLTRDGNDLDKEFGRRGYYFESSYLWPGKMITLTYKNHFYQTRFDYLTNNQNIREDYLIYKTTDSYSVSYNAVESHIDFTNGIKNKLALEFTQNRSGNWPGFLFELSGDTKDIYSRIQFRQKDIGSKTGLGERRIIAVEIRYNLSDSLQFYTRAMNVESLHRNKNWSSAFYQLRYFIGWDVEGYLEFGDGWHTDSLVYDRDITDYERVLANAVKVLFKVNF